MAMLRVWLRGREPAVPGRAGIVSDAAAGSRRWPMNQLEEQGRGAGEGVLGCGDRRSGFLSGSAALGRHRMAASRTKANAVRITAPQDSSGSASLPLLVS